MKFHASYITLFFLHDSVAAKQKVRGTTRRNKELPPQYSVFQGKQDKAADRKDCLKIGARDPTCSPTSLPTTSPSILSKENDPDFNEPQFGHTELDSSQPSDMPSLVPSKVPTEIPSFSIQPSDAPSMTPSKNTMALDFVGDYEMAWYELSECQGDCDYDSDCSLGLVCYRRADNDDGEIPGCEGNANAIADGSANFCIKPPSLDVARIVYDYEDDVGTYPIPKCAADCYSDDDCEVGLACFSATVADFDVPGCDGKGEEFFSYCVEKSLEFVGDYEMDWYELSACQGDCDYDSDCNLGLVCFRGDVSYDGSVPGCAGSASDVADGSTNFCIGPPTDDTARIVYDSEDDIGTYPIPKCAADCVTDDDCQIGLVCYSGVGDDFDVPGCGGKGEEMFSYCVEPLPLTFVGDYEMDWYQLSECQGDCDYDSDCNLGLVCYRGTMDDDGAVPKCKGNANAIADSGTNFCVRPPTAKTVRIVYDYEDDVGTYPISKCAADCVTDDDCREGLICYSGTGNDFEVPGCDGKGEETFSYCVNAKYSIEGFTIEDLSMQPSDMPSLVPSSVPTVASEQPSDMPSLVPSVVPSISPPALPELTFKGNKEFGYYELNACEGDCDYDSDCGIGLVCHERNAGDDGVVLGCSGDANAIRSGNVDFCIERPSESTVNIAYDYEIDIGSFPIGICSADCRNDDDCAGDLVCFKGEGESFPVPGCNGKGEESYGYCIRQQPLTFVGDYIMDWYELELCQGDCDYDSDCNLGLVCERATSGATVPSCSGKAEGVDYCVLRPTPDTVNIVYDSEDDLGSYPIGRCSADCGSDDDCAGDLVCYRAPEDLVIPGCLGKAEEEFSYCIKEEDLL